MKPLFNKRGYKVGLQIPNISWIQPPPGTGLKDFFKLYDILSSLDNTVKA